MPIEGVQSGACGCQLSTVAESSARNLTATRSQTPAALRVEAVGAGIKDLEDNAAPPRPVDSFAVVLGVLRRPR